ncbi:MAG: phosphate ABC transporter substrate-binding protein, partial [Pseudomonadota bacterium]
MRRMALLIAALALTACAPQVDLSSIPEQDDATPIAAIGAAEKIKIVGSSTVSPFSTTVAEQFGAVSDHPAPIVETTGTGGGFK